MKAKRLRVLIPLLILVAVAIFFWLKNGKQQVNTGLLSGNGIVEATEVEVGTKITGRLVTLPPREGDRLKAGDLVATLESDELTGQAELARGNLAAAEAGLAELQAGTRKEEIDRFRAQLEAAQNAVRQAQARRDLVKAGARMEEVEQLRANLRQADVGLQDAEREFDRSKRLEKQGAIPGRDLDQARTRRDAAQTQVDAAVQRLKEAEAGARPEELREVEAAIAQTESQAKAAKFALDLALAGARKESIAAARARVETAQGALRTAESTLALTSITAPIAGSVTLRSSEPGEVVTPGFPMIKIADLAHVWLRVYVPETEVGQVRLGQRAEVTTDSHPGKAFAGLVTEIADKPEFTPKNVQTKEERVKLVFGVKIEIDNPDYDLKPGMPADATIHVR